MFRFFPHIVCKFSFPSVNSKIKNVLLQKQFMAEHNVLGKEGEDAAADYLRKQGYHIRHRNWRSGRKELDIVADNGAELVVVEVKSRRNLDYALPEDAVDVRKIRRIVAATDVYLHKFGLDMPVRFDIITVVGKDEDIRIEHIVEAFYPPIW